MIHWSVLLINVVSKPVTNVKQPSASYLSTPTNSTCIYFWYSHSSVWLNRNKATNCNEKWKTKTTNFFNRHAYQSFNKIFSSRVRRVSNFWTYVCMYMARQRWRKQSINKLCLKRILKQKGKNMQNRKIKCWCRERSSKKKKKTTNAKQLAPIINVKYTYIHRDVRKKMKQITTKKLMEKTVKQKIMKIRQQQKLLEKICQKKKTKIFFPKLSFGSISKRLRNRLSTSKCTI